jgi:hypothetical protein
MMRRKKDSGTNVAIYISLTLNSSSTLQLIINGIANMESPSRHIDWLRSHLLPQIKGIGERDRLGGAAEREHAITYTQC